MGNLDACFAALADPTRRAIIERLASGPANMSALAEPFAMSLVAVQKHVRVLEAAGLVRTQKEGRTRIAHLEAAPMQGAVDWLTRYRLFWLERLDALETTLERSHD